MGAEASPALKIAEYELIRAVGQGGMAQVWLARRALVAGATKACALKVPLSHLAQDERFRRMFLAEARLAMRLTHSNIVGTFDAGSDGDLLYMAMEWVDGVDLSKLQQTLRNASIAWSPSVAAHIVGETLHALTYAHTFSVGREPQSIVHRDVSPHNLLISASGEVKLTDFGVARMLGEETSHEHAKGKLRYMAAEQLRGNATARSDLFAVGAILHELLEGKKFRDGLTGDAFFGAILQGEAPPLTRKDVPEVLVQLHRGLLEPDERRRIASAEEALGLLARWPGYRSQRVALRKVVQRHLGVDRRTSGLTGCIPWTPQMAETLQLVASGGPATAGEATVSPAPPRLDAVLPGGLPRMAELETVSVEPLVQGGGARQRVRTGLWVGASMLLGIGIGGGVAVGAWRLASGVDRPVPPVAAAPDQDGTVVREVADAPPAMARVAAASPAPAFGAAPVLAPAPVLVAAPAPAPAPATGERPRVESASPSKVIAASTPVPMLSSTAAAPSTSRKRPASRAPRVSVHLMLDFVEEAEVFVGRTRRVVRGPVIVHVAAGRHRVSWRPVGSTTWVARKTFTLDARHDHLIRIRPAGLRHQAVARRPPADEPTVGRRVRNYTRRPSR